MSTKLREDIREVIMKYVDGTINVERCIDRIIDCRQQLETRPRSVTFGGQTTTSRMTNAYRPGNIFDTKVPLATSERRASFDPQNKNSVSCPTDGID
ncbi:unnamed protein product [Didymodactylos carnosus]|uniref:Uncharacterized protein n=1 Tax=Didymodactylos carnosus TaxID=1234261 RepID=A0A814Y1R6_9BILA|nr:unnamed protein product [Didymodactylos carnosus]CAF1357740.1 unnamed protein product [Didymodactylos carnosus]CAF3986516.1 unnamed protein product [Didymodactylos carnosus]CAF4168062.1 unnamed protein product [Didymodactylos carnosus]